MECESLVGTPARRDPILEPRSYPVPRTVLYIEDTVAIVELVTMMLSRRPSITVLSSTTGQEGIAIARRAMPDLILLDLNLPDISGAEVMRTLLSDPATRAIPVVVLSADATPQQFDRLSRMGARAYLTKPVPMRTLLETVDMHIEPVLATFPVVHPRP